VPGVRLAAWLVLAGLSAFAPRSRTDLPAASDRDRGLLLRHVTVIDGTGRPPRRDAYVLVRDGRIAAVGDSRGAPSAPGIDLRDLPDHMVLPGFIALHEHVTFLRTPSGADPEYDDETTQEVLKRLLEFGITTVRNPQAPTDAGVRVRERIQRGEVAGPRLYTAGWYGRLSAEAIRREVQMQAAAGVDFLKLYAGLNPEQVAVAIEEAHRRGLKVIGHLQRTDWTFAAEHGIDYLTHGSSWSVAELPPDKRDAYTRAMREEGAMKARIHWLEWVESDGPEIRRMIRALVDHHVGVDPTLVAYDTKFRNDDPFYRASPDLRFVPPAMRLTWQRGTFVDDWTADDFARARAVWRVELGLVKRYFDAGVRLTAGSDLPNPWVVPGAAFHRELELLHDAGIAIEDVLRIATRNGAEALGIAREVGTIEPGKRADLVVLAKDPLVDIRNTRVIVVVLQNGRIVAEPHAAPPPLPTRP
jgi:imidazolonepropionase-like amidohydrolase